MGKPDDSLSLEDKYIIKNTVVLSDLQKELIKETRKLENYCMISSPEQIKYLSSMCSMIGAKKTLDIGVYTGYSAMSIASILPDDGKVIAMDISKEYTDIGKPFWKRAKVDDIIELKLAPAIDSLKELLDDGEAGTFDFAFVDAIKTEYEDYYELLLKLLRKGGVIAFDNMFGFGQCLQEDNQHEIAVYLREFTLKLSDDKRISFDLLNLGDGTGIAVVK